MSQVVYDPDRDRRTTGDCTECGVLVTVHSQTAALPTPLRRLAAALTYRDFRVLWFGAFTSSIGTWMQKVAQNWLVLTLDRRRRPRSTSASIPSSAKLPILLFTLIGGVVADRRDRRQLLLMSQYIQMSAAFTLAALVYWDVVRIWHVLTLSVITGLAQAFGGPAYQSLIPSLVDKQHLPNAIALNSIQFNLARVIGPLLAGAALAAFGMVACFGLNGLSFLAVIVAILSLHIRHIPAPTTTRMHEELKSGFAYVRAPAGADRPHRAGIRHDVPRHSGPDVPAAVRAGRLPRRRQPVHAADGVCRRRRRRPARSSWPGSARFTHMGLARARAAGRVRHAGRALRHDARAVGQRVPAVRGRRVHGDGVRDALVARAAHCARTRCAAAS